MINKIKMIFSNRKDIPFVGMLFFLFLSICFSNVYSQEQYIELLEPQNEAIFSPATNAIQTEELNNTNNDGAEGLFSWIAPIGLTSGARVTYLFRVVPVYDCQSPYDAIILNFPFFEKQNLMATIFQFPAASHPFDAGKHYAW